MLVAIVLRVAWFLCTFSSLQSYVGETCSSEIYIDGNLFHFTATSALLIDAEVVKFSNTYQLNDENMLAVRNYHLLNCHPEFSRYFYGPVLVFRDGIGRFVFQMFRNEFPGDAVIRFCKFLKANLSSEICTTLRQAYFSLLQKELIVDANRTFPASSAYLSMPALAFGIGGLFTNFILSKYDYLQGHTVDGSTLNKECVEQILSALTLGYNHIDTAEQYGNDRELGEALKMFYFSTGHQRESVWITSKIDKSVFNPVSGVQSIIERIGCKYLDLVLVHIPREMLQHDHPEEHYPNTAYIWEQMERLVLMGLVRYIGLSNFRITDLQELLPSCSTRPYINLFEFHPYLQQRALREFCAREGIRVASYGGMAPLTTMTGGPLDSLLPILSERYKVSTGAILVRYAQQEGFAVVTSTKKYSRLVENLAASPVKSHNGGDGYHFTLDVSDMSLIRTTCANMNYRYHFREQIVNRFQKVPKNSAFIHNLGSLENVWTSIDFNYKYEPPSEYPEPLKALIDGVVSSIIIREALLPKELNTILERLENSNLLVNSRSGSIALKFPFHRDKFQERIGSIKLYTLISY